MPTFPRIVNVGTVVLSILCLAAAGAGPLTGQARRKSQAGRAVYAARERGESERMAIDRVMQAESPMLPRRSDSGADDDGTISIADYNANSQGQADVSHIIDQIAVSFPPDPGCSGPTRTLLFPPGLYLIDPPANVTTGGQRVNGGYYYTPTHLTLKFATGAMLLSGQPMLRTLIGGTVIAEYTQQIFAPSPRLPNIEIQIVGLTAHVHLGCAPGASCIAHGFNVGDRFFISGSSRSLNGGHAVTAVKDVYDFEFMLLHEPKNTTEGGNPTISIASWYFIREAYPGQNLFRAMAGQQQWVTPEWWGAFASVEEGDSTVAVQSSLDSGAAGVMLISPYRVSRVSIEGSGRTVEGHGGSLSPMDNARPNPVQFEPVGTLNAVLEIKCDYSEIRNFAISGGFNGTYTAAVHWYSNNMGIWYVGFNKLKNLHIAYAKIGLLVGAAPGQDPQYFAPGYSGGTAPDGVAINTALSESYIDGLSLRGTEKGFYMNQPNGVLHMLNSFLYASSQDWPGPPGQVNLPGYNWNEACPLELHGSFAIQVESCDLEVNQNGEWTPGGSGIRIANVTGTGKLSIKDTCVEMQGSFHIGGKAAVSWDGNTDGYSSSPFPTFEIAPDATGSLLLTNVAWVRPTGWGDNMPVQFVSRQVSAAFPDSLFRVTLDTVRLINFNFDIWSTPFSPVLPDPAPARPPPPPSGYQPVTRGVRTEIRDLTIVHSLCTDDPNATSQDIFCGHGKPIDASVVVIRPGRTNLLRTSQSAVDVSAASIPLSVAAGHDFSATPIGGWMVNVSGSQSSFHGLNATELPKLGYFEQPLPNTAFQHTKTPFRWPAAVRRGLRLRSEALPSSSAIIRVPDPGLPVEPATNYVLTGWVRTNGIGTITIHTQWLTFAGVPSGRDEQCDFEHKSDATVCGARATLPMNSSWVGFHENMPLWEPLLVRLESAWDAAFVRLGFEASAGAQLDLCDLGLH